MSIRPTSFGVGETWTWNIRLRNVANAAVDADSTPTVTVYKNNAATGESVTVTKPSATTGWYQCSFDPAGEAEHDVYSFVENVTIAAVAQAPFQWEAVVLAAERGTDSAATAANMTVALDSLGYLMAAEIGVCADAGTAAETYAITVNGSTYTIDHTGLDTTGNRGTATLTKS